MTSIGLHSIIYGQCKHCHGYLMNVADPLSVSLGCLDIRCINCGEPDDEVEKRFRDTMHEAFKKKFEVKE